MNEAEKRYLEEIVAGFKVDPLWYWSRQQYNQDDWKILRLMVADGVIIHDGSVGTGIGRAYPTMGFKLNLFRWESISDDYKDENRKMDEIIIAIENKASEDGIDLVMMDPKSILNDLRFDQEYLYLFEIMENREWIEMGHAVGDTYFVERITKQGINAARRYNA